MILTFIRFSTGKSGTLATSISSSLDIVLVPSETFSHSLLMLPKKSLLGEIINWSPEIIATLADVDSDSTVQVRGSPSIS